MTTAITRKMIEYMSRKPCMVGNLGAVLKVQAVTGQYVGDIGPWRESGKGRRRLVTLAVAC
jgi:hypothetical protein